MENNKQLQWELDYFSELETQLNEWIAHEVNDLVHYKDLCGRDTCPDDATLYNKVNDIYNVNDMHNDNCIDTPQERVAKIVEDIKYMYRQRKYIDFNIARIQKCMLLIK